MCERLLFAILLSLVSVASAGGQTALRWKFEVGNVYECERIVTQSQSVELKGKAFPSNRRSTWQVRLEVIEKNAGAARLLATLVKVEHRITPANADDMVDPKLDAKMQGSSFHLVVANSGQITQCHGYEDFLNRLAKEDQGKRKALRATFPEETLRQAFADFFGPLPEKAVGKGDSWQRDYVEPIPHFGRLRSTAHYVYAGTKNAEAQIPYTIQTKYELPKDDKSVLFRIVQGVITSDRATGNIVFDGSAGFLLQQDRRLHLRGTLTIDVMERPYAMEFTSDTEWKIRIKATKR